jgi:hypothetical protein
MVLVTEKIKKYSKIIKSLIGQGNQYTESLFLDLKQGRIYIDNDDLYLKARLLIDVEENDESNFYVDIDQFVKVCELYPELNLNEKKFSYGKETYKFTTISEDYSSPDLFDNNYSDCNIILTDELKKVIKFYKTFVDTDYDGEMHGAFIRDNQLIIGSAGRKVLFHKCESEFDFNFNYEVFLILSLLNIDDVVELKNNNNYMTLVINDEFEFIFQENKKLQCEDFNSCQHLFMHKTFIKVDRLRLIEELKILNSFTLEKKVDFLVQGNTLKFQIIENQLTKLCNIERFMAIEDVVGDFNPDIFYSFRSDDLMKSLSMFTDDNVKIRLSTNKDDIAVYLESETDKLSVILMSC